MTEIEYLTKQKELLNEYNYKQFNLRHKFASENNPYMTGDIIKDHIGYIKIESFELYTGSKLPSIVYYGLELKKDLTPRKDGKKRKLWQENIES